jgi:hypothetical protein
MKKVITIVIGMFMFLMGAGFTLPGLAKARDFGAMPADLVGIYTLGIVLALVGMSIVHFGLSKRNAV